MDARNWLLVGGGIATLGAIAHVVVLIGGPEWIAFVKAPPSVVESSRQGTWLAPVSILLITAVISVCALYAFSGADLVPRLPFLGYVLALIGGLCLLRALLLLPVLIMRPAVISHLSAFDIVSTAIFVVMGIAYSVGARSVLTMS